MNHDVYNILKFQASLWCSFRAYDTVSGEIINIAIAHCDTLSEFFYSRNVHKGGGSGDTYNWCETMFPKLITKHQISKAVPFKIPLTITITIGNGKKSYIIRVVNLKSTWWKVVGFQFFTLQPVRSFSSSWNTIELDYFQNV